MSAELIGQGDWTATVEQAVAVEIVRRRRWLRAYLALVLLITLATLALVWLQRETPDGEVERRLQPLAATTQRLSTQQVALARHQMDLAGRLTRLEAEAAALAAALQPVAAARQAPPAVPVPPPATTQALARLAWRQDRLDGSVATLQHRLQRLEAPAAAAGREAEGASSAVGIDARLDRLDAALRALEAAASAAPAPAPAPPAPGPAATPATDAAAQRLDALDQRLGRLERTAVRAGAASAD